MNNLKVFQNSDFGELSVMMIDGKEYFPAAQCARILGYSNPQKAVRDHCDEDGCTKRSVIDSLGRTQEMKFINEGNLYRLIIRSKLPAAKKFERWVFDEVLPEIRRSGGYGGINLEEVIARAVSTAVSETVKAIKPLLERPAPDILYDTYEPDMRRRGNYSIISKLEPVLRTEVDDMLLSRKYTYDDVKQFLAEQGIAISLASVQRYAKRIYRG
ncbi:MAG: DUF3486 family protein [Ruminococcus sp.]|nr:DUF3486 family protein [Ruminococcus sp.]